MQVYLTSMSLVEGCPWISLCDDLRMQVYLTSMSLEDAPGSARSECKPMFFHFARNPQLFWLSQPSLGGSTLQRLCVALARRLACLRPADFSARAWLLA